MNGTIRDLAEKELQKLENMSLNPRLLDIVDESVSKLPYARERIEPRRVQKLPGRNDQCPCGSGKKYKNCCINKYASDNE